MFWLVQTIVPIAICVVLPLGIVWLVFRTAMNKNNKDAEIIMKAIEANPSIDADKLIASLAKRPKTPRQVLQTRLLCGCIFTFVGIAIGIVTAIMTYLRGDISDLLGVLLLGSAFCLAIGIAYLVVYFVTRKSVQQSESADCDKI